MKRQDTKYTRGHLFIYFGVGADFSRGKIDKSAPPFFFASKHPTLIPRDSHIATIIIVYHVHVQSLLGDLNSFNLIHKQYWIPNNQSLIRKRIFKCNGLDFEIKLLPNSWEIFPSADLNREDIFLGVALDMDSPYLLKDGNRRVLLVKLTSLHLFV